MLGFLPLSSGPISSASTLTTSLLLQTVNAKFAASPRDHTTNLVILAEYSSNITSDSLLKSAFSISYSSNSLLRSVSTLSHSSDALCFGIVERYHSASALFLLSSTKVSNTNSLLRSSSSLGSNTNSLFIPDVRSHVTDAVFNKSSSRSLLSQVVLWRSILGDGVGSFGDFGSSSAGLNVFTVPQSIADVVVDNRIILREAGWGSRDISGRLAGQDLINFRKPYSSDGALFSVFDDRLANVVLKDPVSVGVHDALVPFSAPGAKPTARTSVKSFDAPALEKSMAVFEPPRRKINKNR